MSNLSKNLEKLEIYWIFDNVYAIKRKYVIMGLFVAPPLFEPFGFCEGVGVKEYQFAVQIHAKLWPHSPHPTHYTSIDCIG